jgi:hypothetical protein
MDLYSLGINCIRSPKSGVYIRVNPLMQREGGEGYEVQRSFQASENQS